MIAIANAITGLPNVIDYNCDNLACYMFDFISIKTWILSCWKHLLWYNITKKQIKVITHHDYLRSWLRLQLRLHLIWNYDCDFDCDYWQSVIDCNRLQLQITINPCLDNTTVKSCQPWFQQVALFQVIYLVVWNSVIGKWPVRGWPLYGVFVALLKKNTE